MAVSPGGCRPAAGHNYSIATLLATGSLVGVWRLGPSHWTISGSALPQDVFGLKWAFFKALCNDSMYASLVMVAPEISLTVALCACNVS